MSRLGLVVNPGAGSGRGRRTGAAVVAALRGRGHEVRALAAGLPAAGPPADDLADATDLADLDGVVVVGGDGTVHRALQRTAGTGVPLGIVPAGTGTGNDVAAALGVPRRDVAAAVAVVERGLTDGPRSMDAVHAGPAVPAPARAADDGARGAAAGRWYLGVLSCGFDAAVSARAHTMAWPGGSGRYLRAVAAELRGFAPYGYRITLDDEVWASAGTLVAIANAPRFGGGIAIAPHARMDDGLLDVVVAGAVTRRGLVGVLPVAYRGQHLRHPAVRVVRSRSVLVEADATLGGPPPTAFADGEPLGPLPLRVTVRPGAVAVLA